MFIVFLLLFLPPLTLIQMVVHVFLFTDLLLLTKAAKGKNFTIVRPVSTLKLMYGHIPSRFPSNSGHTVAQMCASLRTLCKSKLHEEACMHTCMFACNCSFACKCACSLTVVPDGQRDSATLHVWLLHLQRISGNLHIVYSCVARHDNAQHRIHNVRHR